MFIQACDRLIKTKTSLILNELKLIHLKFEYICRKLFNHMKHYLQKIGKPKIKTVFWLPSLTKNKQHLDPNYKERFLNRNSQSLY